MRVVITGGGTGGHIYPALAVAEALCQDRAVTDILYIGNQTSLEAELVPQYQIPFQGITFRGMPRKNLLQWLLWFIELQMTIGRCKSILKKYKPNVVFGTGGYVSAPVVMAAQQLGIPTIIHEPDAHPGLANRQLAKKAKAITAAFAASEHAFKLKGQAQKFHATGNPIRQEIGQINRQDALSSLELDQKNNWHSEKTTLLVFGGSQGARTINQAIIGCLGTLINQYDMQILHITGKKLFTETQATLAQQTIKHANYVCLPFCDQMPEVLAISDVAVCRAGSLTLSEMYVSGIPTVLVPYPFAAADHQRANAQASVNAGASQMLLDDDCTPQTLTATLTPMLQSPDVLTTMADAARQLAKPKATQAIVKQIKQVAS